MAGIDEALVEWEQVWLESLMVQVHDLHHRRELHDGFMALLEASDHRDTDIFSDAFHRTYIESQVMAIRRQADDDSRTLSLRKLIGQIEQRRREFTRAWYVGRWMAEFDADGTDERRRLEAKFHPEAANHAFDQFADEEGDDLIGGRRLQADRERLLQLTDDVVQYANTVVAHAQRDPSSVSVTYDDFHRAVDHLGEMLKRYYLLINQGGLVSAAPVIQGDWRGPFRKPLAE